MGLLGTVYLVTTTKPLHFLAHGDSGCAYFWRADRELGRSTLDGRDGRGGGLAGAWLRFRIVC